MPTKILIVDDSVSMRQMTSIILKSAGYEPVEAADGDEALARLDESVALVISDYNMPRMNGVELIRRIRASGPNRAVPVLMVTTESEESKKMEGKEAGATGWITKPFDKERLIGTIRKVLGSISF